jgi:hypothetical protein
MVMSQGAFFWAALWASICLWNAGAHAVWSVATRAYQPGLITGLLYAPFFGVWLWQIASQDNLPWSILWLALLIGFLITVTLAGIALMGRRVLP